MESIGFIGGLGWFAACREAILTSEALNREVLGREQRGRESFLITPHDEMRVSPGGAPAIARSRSPWSGEREAQESREGGDGGDGLFG
jgi:hypothetical protein